MPTKFIFHLSSTNPSTLTFVSANAGDILQVKEEGIYLNVYIADTSRQIGGVQAAIVLWIENDQTAPQP